MNTQTNTTTSVFDAYLGRNGTETIIFDSIPEKDYHAEKRFVSKHMLDLIADSPEKFRAAMDSTEEREPTPSMVLGSAFHCAVLEPERFHERYAVKPEGIDRRTKAGKEAFAAWEAENAGKEVLDSEQMETIKGMRDSLLAHPLVGALWKQHGISERTIISRDEETGLPLKCRIDRVFPAASASIAIDLKTCASARPDEFNRVVANFRYYVQAAYYRDLLEKADGKEWTFIFIAVETKAPFSVAVYQVSEWLPLGVARYRRDLAKLAECMKTGEWRGYEVPNDELPMPKWLMAQEGF